MGGGSGDRQISDASGLGGRRQRTGLRHLVGGPADFRRVLTSNRPQRVCVYVGGRGATQLRLHISGVCGGLRPADFRRVCVCGGGGIAKK